MADSFEVLPPLPLSKDTHRVLQAMRDLAQGPVKALAAVQLNDAVKNEVYDHAIAFRHMAMEEPDDGLHQLIDRASVQDTTGSPFILDPISRLMMPLSVAKLHHGLTPVRNFNHFWSVIPTEPPSTVEGLRYDGEFRRETISNPKSFTEVDYFFAIFENLAHQRLAERSDMVRGVRSGGVVPGGIVVFPDMFNTPEISVTSVAMRRVDRGTPISSLISLSTPVLSHETSGIFATPDGYFKSLYGHSGIKDIYFVVFIRP